MKTHKVIRSIFKPSNLFISCALLFTLSVNANEISVLGAPLPVYTQDADKPHKSPVPVTPQVADPDLPVQTSKIKMAVGDKIYLLGKGSALSNYNVIQMLGMQIICRGELHTEIVGDLFSTRNHLGKDIETNGVLSLVVRYLFIAPYADTYTCSLRAQNFTGQGAVAGTHYWTLQKGSTNTYLSVDPSVPGSISWGTGLDTKDDQRAINAGRPVGDYADDSVHIANNNALFNDAGEFALRSPKWTPTADTIKAISDIEVTACYYGTGSCRTYAYGANNDAAKAAGSIIKTRLIVDEYKNGETDPANYCNRTNGDYVQVTISSDTHHRKIFHNLDVAKLPIKCGESGSYFRSRVDIQWLGGNPIRIENSEYSHGAFINMP
jgi:hypothetical protein